MDQQRRNNFYFFERNERGGTLLAVGGAVLEKIEVVAPLLVHETQETFEDNSSFHDAGPRQNGLDVFFERRIKNRCGSLHHPTDVMRFLAGIGVAIKHA